MKPGRNDPCPCGSGKKYKKCCQENPSTTAPEVVNGAAPAPAEYDRLAALFNAGQHAELESRARLLLERHPDSGFAWKALAASLQVQGKDCLPALKKATELLPEDIDMPNNLGLVFQERGRRDEAEAGYRRALQVKPDYFAAHYNPGNWMLNGRHIAEAEVPLNAALKQMQPDLRACCLFSKVYQQTKRIERAARAKADCRSHAPSEEAVQ